MTRLVTLEPVCHDAVIDVDAKDVRKADILIGSNFSDNRVNV